MSESKNYIGQKLKEWTVIRKLGEGGFAATYLLFYPQIDRHAVMKVLHEQHASRPDIVARFLNEARAVNMIGHPGIPKVFEFGRLPGGDWEGPPYFLMDYLEGESLDKRLRDLADRPRDRLLLALWAGEQIASAVAAAHKQRIAHRDLKPENIMLVPDPTAPAGERAKVLDFGIAKLAHDSQSGPGDVTKASPAVTRPQEMMGTPGYMAPEQWNGLSEAGPPADVYSLGIVLYEALVGQRPFDAPDWVKLAVKHMQDPPPDLRIHAPTVPPPLVALVHSMLAKAPADRPTMAEVGARLGSMAGSLVAPPISPPSHNRWLLVALGGVTILLAAVLASQIHHGARQVETKGSRQLSLQGDMARAPIVPEAATARLEVASREPVVDGSSNGVAALPPTTSPPVPLIPAGVVVPRTTTPDPPKVSHRIRPKTETSRAQEQWSVATVPANALLYRLVAGEKHFLGETTAIRSWSQVAETEGPAWKLLIRRPGCKDKTVVLEPGKAAALTIELICDGD